MIACSPEKHARSDTESELSLLMILGPVQRKESGPKSQVATDTNYLSNLTTTIDVVTRRHLL